MASAGGKSGLEIARKMMSFVIKEGGLDKNLLDKVRVTSAENGRLTAELTVQKEYCNANGTLHGGMICYLVDCISTMALISVPNVQSPGVSIDLHTKFLKSAPIGQDIEIISTVDKIGGKIAFLTVDILNKGTGELVAKGSHTKFTSDGFKPKPT